jgi:hypothetical protein
VTVPAAAPRRLARLGDGALERLLVFLVAGSLLGLLLGWTGAFSPYAVLVGATLVALGYRPASRGGTDEGLAWRHLLPVLLVAVALRVPAGDYVLGGQDQGVYTAMASELLRSGDLRVVDGEWSRLAAAGQADAYRRDNYTVPFIPGVYSDGGATPSLQFQFYHVFPVWLAVAQGLLGEAAGGWALVLLALASIVFFQRLAGVLSGNARLGMATGALLALNPLHAMFSRFPVTEVPTLAFSAAGFLFLARYALADAEDRRAGWLALSVAAFLTLFLVRISGFMYLPLIGMVSVVALCADDDRARARALTAWSLGCVLAYALSVGYGLAWSRPYAMDIYRASFSMLGGEAWPMLLAGAVVLAGSGWLALGLAAEHPVARRIGRGLSDLRPALGVLLALIIVAGAWKAWKLGFTQAFATDAWLSRFPGIAGGGARGAAHASLVVVATYLSPWLLLALPWLAGRRMPAAGALLAFFVACFLAYAAFLNWTVVYQPYYARYFCSELVPYALLLAVLALAWPLPAAARRALAVALVLSGLWFGVLSARQWGPPENAGARASIGRLAALVHDDDVLLLDVFHGPGWQPKEIKSTLVYVFGRHVVSIGDRGMGDAAYLRALAEAYGDVLLVTEGPVPPPGFETIGSVPLSATGYERGPWPPHRRTATLDASLFVHRLRAAPPAK